MKPFLIIETGDPVPDLRRHGGFGHWIRVAAGLPRQAARCVRVHDGEDLPDPSRFAGVLVSGSGAMVTDRADWSERSAAWLGDAARAGHPVFGICYGHQLLAHALGGEVAHHPEGVEIGTVTVQRHPTAADDPLLGELPDAFAAQAVHWQSVRRLPPGAVLLAGSAHEAHHAFRVGEQAWGVQFHPEFSVDALRAYLDGLGPTLAREGRDAAQIAAGLQGTPEAASLLPRFARLVLSESRSNGPRAPRA